MKKRTIIIATILLAGIVSCKQSSQDTANKDNNVADTTVVAKTETTTIERTDDSQETAARPPLNDIRFAGWSHNDWYDNEYIRTLRKHIDDIADGKAESSILEPYKNILKSKFVILIIEPFIAGGLFMQFAFIDNPKVVFTTSVYSFVDEDTETVTGYETRGITIATEEYDITKEEILQIIKEHPENKLW